MVIDIRLSKEALRTVRIVLVVLTAMGLLPKTMLARWRMLEKRHWASGMKGGKHAWSNIPDVHIDVDVKLRHLVGL